MLANISCKTTGLVRHLISVSGPYLVNRGKAWSAVQSGEKGTLDYKVYLRDENGSAVSSVHDIPLNATTDNVFNMVVEVPRWSNAKLEVSLNPSVFLVCTN